MPEVHFVGRAREQDVYHKFLAKETPWVLIITGLGGIGKTTLLHRLAEYTLSESTRYKKAVITIDFANEDLRSDPLKLLDKLTADTASYCDLQQIDNDFKEVLQQNIDQLAQLSTERAQTDISASDDPALREIHHQMRELATEAFYTQIKTYRLHQLVMMLDTCEWLNEPEGIEVGQWVLNELIPGLHTRIRRQGQQCHVVLASRVQLKLEAINGRDQQRLTLSMLGNAEVARYLEYVGMQDAGLRKRVYEVTHGHALCVTIIGDFWRQREAQQEPFTIADLPELQIKEFSEKALMQFTNERVLKQLKSPYKELTRYGVLLRSFDLPLLRNVFPELLPENESLEIFNQLIRYPYIESRGNYRYAFHALLREALAEVTHKDEPDEWRVYHKRALDYFAEISTHSPDWYYHLLAYDEKQGLIEWQKAIQQARESGKREFIGALLQAALDGALHLSPAAQAEISYEQGRFNYYGVQWQEALKSYNEALTYFQQVEDNSGKAKVLQAMGDIQRAIGMLDAAMMSYEQAVGLFQRLKDQLGEAKCSQAMGDINFDLDDALLCYEHCLLVFRQLKDRSEEAKALESIGDVHRLRNNFDEALHCYEQALVLYQEKKDRLKRAKVLKAMGDVQRQRQERNAVLENYGQALALFGELKEPIEEANVRRAIEEMQGPVQATLSSPSSDIANFGSNSSDGGSWANSLKVQSDFHVTLPTQPYQPASSQHVSESPIPPYVQSGQQQYTPLPPLQAKQQQYTPPPPQVQQSHHTPTHPPFPVYNPPQDDQQKRSPMLTVILGVIALVIILAGVSGFFIYHQNQVNQDNTSMMATEQAHANTATASAQATQNVNATATGIATSHFPPFTSLSFYDSLRTRSNPNWSSNTSCMTSSNGLQVSSAQVNPLNPYESCFYLPRAFSEFAYQATMNIEHGDCGGLIFRYVDRYNLFLFEVCQNGRYNLYAHINNQWNSLYKNDSPSAVILQGLNKQNVLAVTVQGDTVNMYVNGQRIDAATDQDLTSNKFRTGSIALVADNVSNPTAVIYTNALVWTM